MWVAIVGDHHAGLQCNDVVAVIPLLALGLPVVASGLHHAQLFEPERFLDHVEQMPLVGVHLHPAIAGRARAVAADLACARASTSDCKSPRCRSSRTDRAGTRYWVSGG